MPSLLLHVAPVRHVRREGPVPWKYTVTSEEDRMLQGGSQWGPYEDPLVSPHVQPKPRSLRAGEVLNQSIGPCSFHAGPTPNLGCQS